MTLQNVYPWILRAHQEGWAVGAFNANTLEQVQAIVLAAQAEEAPAIIQISHRALTHVGSGNGPRNGGWLKNGSANWKARCIGSQARERSRSSSKRRPGRTPAVCEPGSCRCERTSNGMRADARNCCRRWAASRANSSGWSPEPNRWTSTRGRKRS